MEFQTICVSAPINIALVKYSQLRARRKGQDVARYVQIESENNFPTAAGLASSASGTAALDAASIARRGSGSGCRSLHGGYVHWLAHPSNNLSDPNFSLVKQVYPKSHWPALRILICVVDQQTKSIGSTNGMQRTVETSMLYQLGRSISAKQNEQDLLNALCSCDFTRLAEITMRESNQLHAVCLDTWPPCVYLNQTSYALIQFVQTINNYFGHTLLAYTFDAGPNAFLLAEVQNVPLIIQLLTLCFGSSNVSGDSDQHVSVSDNIAKCRKFLKLLGIKYYLPENPVDEDLLKQLPHSNGSVLYVISTEVGDGPEILEFSNQSS